MRIVILATLLMFAGCEGADGQGGGYTLEGSPVLTDPPNAEGQAPAFAGQTRAPEAHTDVELDVSMIATDLDEPWALEFMPDGRLLVTERPGRLRVVNSEGEISPPIAGVPEVDARNQGGLLDIALSRTFASDRTIYLSFSEQREEGRTSTSVARGRLNAAANRLEDVQVIFRQEPAWDSTYHYGSRLVWDRDGHLFVTTGERSNPDSRQLAQDLGAHLGKVLRLNADGSAASDNPFVGRAGARPEIWSYGHRNIQGAALNPETGELWTIEHGPRGGDELNVARAGRNYGWPIITYGEDYSGSPIGEGITQQEGMEQPLYYWDPVIAPGGMLFYEGAMFPEWRGDVFISGLRGYLVRLELDGERVVAEERLAAGSGRVRDVKEDRDGALWFITDENSGGVFRVQRRR